MGIIIFKKFKHFIDSSGKTFDEAYLDGYWVDPILENIYFVININSSGYLHIRLEERFKNSFPSTIKSHLKRAKKRVEAMLVSGMKFNVGLGLTGDIVEMKYISIIKKGSFNIIIEYLPPMVV